jgi:hypothetical protein
MSEALKEKEPGLAGLMDTPRNREKARAAQCREGCRFPAWAGGCPYLYARGTACPYYGPNYGEEDGGHGND